MHKTKPCLSDAHKLLLLIIYEIKPFSPLVLPRSGSVLTPTLRFQTLVSPGYPYLYPNNFRRDWIIQTASSNQILLKITDFITETCCDYVEVCLCFV